MLPRNSAASATLPSTTALLRSLQFGRPSAPLFESDPRGPTQPRRRSKIWELAASFHCSIIGTCLSTAELRRLLGKLKLASPGASDHDLHAKGVGLASRRDGSAKLLNKALDERHRAVIRQFERAASEGEVRALWQEARDRGEIPAAYWAVLSHPATSPALARDVFGEVHMLSHLVGASNRADLKRLAQLERDNATLQEKVLRQQTQLRDAVTARDRRIAELGRALAAKIAEQHRGEQEPPSEDERTAVLTRLVADVERRLAREKQCRERAEQRLAEASARLERESAGRAAAEARALAMQDELGAIEDGLAATSSSAREELTGTRELAGRALLYVGGRPSQIAALRRLAERHGAQLLHHDGGVDDRGGLLRGLIGRADFVLFPVDCVSHDAAIMVKRLCRQTEKPFLPLRSAGLTSFAAAIGRMRKAHLPDAQGT